MKINGATSLLQLQNVMSELSVDMRVDFVASAQCWRVRLNQRGSAAVVWIGVGRSIGDAMQEAVVKYKDVHS